MFSDDVMSGDVPRAMELASREKGHQNALESFEVPEEVEAARVDLDSEDRKWRVPLPKVPGWVWSAAQLPEESSGRSFPDQIPLAVPNERTEIRPSRVLKLSDAQDYWLGTM